MSNDTAKTQTTNIVPVQGIFEPAPTFGLVSLIGPAGTPFYANVDPAQSGLNITSSTINSTTIGAITPSTATFTQVTLPNTPVSPTDATNKSYVDNFVAGISWKEPVLCATTANITLSGTQTIDGTAVVVGDRVLVKDQSTAANNGIYVVSAGSWTRAVGADDYAEYEGAVVFVITGTGNSGTTWYCSAQPGGTLGVTALNWFALSVSLTYTAGTGLTLAGTQFSITDTGVSAATYGSASTVPVLAVNAQGQITSVTNTGIAINGNQITSGTVGSSYINGAYSGITGVGTLTDLTVTNTISGSINGNAATATTAGSATTATTATNIAGGASGSIPYQTGSGATALLAKGTDGQILALASGLPAWIDNQTGTVTSVSGTGTVSGISLSGTVTSSGSLTLGGTLDLSSPPAIGGSIPNSITASTLTVNDNTTFGSSNTDTVAFTARINSEFSPATDNTYDLGRTGHEWRDLYIDGTANIDSLVADTADINAGTIDNTTIGATTAASAKVTTLDITSTLALNGSTGTSGYVLTSNGGSAATWQALPSSGITVTDDTTTNATRYITFTSATSGSITGENVSSTKLQYNPSTGTLSSTAFVGDGSGLTNVGTFPSGTVLLFYQASAPTGWTQVTSLNDYDLRLVSGTGGTTGGTTAYSTVFSNQTPTISSSFSAGATTLSTAQMPSHSHINGTKRIHDAADGIYGVGASGTDSNVLARQTGSGQPYESDNTQTIGSSSSHTHSISGSATSSAITLNVRYANVIICSKN